MNKRRLKILYITHRVPYPPIKGDKIRSFNTIKYLTRFHTVDLICMTDKPEERRCEAHLKKYCRKVAIVPFRKLRATIDGIFYLIRGRTISEGYHYNKNFIEKLDAWLDEVKYDAIIVFSSFMGEHIRLRSQRKRIDRTTRLIMDFCDVDSDKWNQYYQKSWFPSNLIYRIESKRLFEYEKVINRVFDHSVFISLKEVELFRKLAPKAMNISVIPNGVDAEYFYPQKGAPDKLSASPVIMFVGAMDYFANIEGVKWFCRKILGKIRAEFPSLKFFIVGQNPIPSVKRLEKIGGVEVTGYVKDTRHYYQNSELCVVPLRIARGVQNKVLEAMAMKMAVVTTSAAVQGIDVVPGKHLMLADNSEEFSKIVLELLKDPQRREELGAAARKFIETEYVWHDKMKMFEELIYS